MTSAMRRTLVAALALLAASAACPLHAAQPAAPVDPPPKPAAKGGPGDLLVAPTRVVFEGRGRSAEVTLINTGTRAATYRISFVQMRMMETGEIRQVEVADPGERFADGLIRFSPRQVRLDPSVAQTVRLQLRKPSGLEPGEYRSHLLFRAIPEVEPATLKEEPVTGIQIGLTPIYGITIPVIVRHGETSARASLSGLALVPASGDGETTLRLRMSRTGDRSVFGNLAVTFVPASGPGIVVAIANGVAVYTPNPLRIVNLELRPPPGVTLGRGLLRASYTSPDQPGPPIAEAELALP